MNLRCQVVSIGVHPNTENTKKGPECAQEQLPLFNSCSGTSEFIFSQIFTPNYQHINWRLDASRPNSKAVGTTWGRAHGPPFGVGWLHRTGTPSDHLAKWPRQAALRPVSSGHEEREYAYNQKSTLSSRMYFWFFLPQTFSIVACTLLCSGVAQHSWLPPSQTQAEFKVQGRPLFALFPRDPPDPIPQSPCREYCQETF